MGEGGRGKREWEGCCYCPCRLRRRRDQRGREKVRGKKNASDLAELSRRKRCQDTGEVTAAAECLRKSGEGRTLRLACSVGEKDDESAADQASLCFRMRLIKTRERVRALCSIPGLMRLQRRRTASTISSNPPHQVNSAPQTCLLCMACRDNDKRHPGRHILTPASAVAGETSLRTFAHFFHS